jgi:hypothetical protein
MRYFLQQVAIAFFSLTVCFLCFHVRGTRHTGFVVCDFQVRFGPGLKEIHCSAALKKSECEISPLQNFLVIVHVIKLNESYCVSYLYLWSGTVEKGVDPFSGQPMNIPRD